MYESAFERQIKPCKRRKITDSGIFIIHWNIISSMKWFTRSLILQYTQSSYEMYFTYHTNSWYTQCIISRHKWYCI